MAASRLSSPIFFRPETATLPGAPKGALSLPCKQVDLVEHLDDRFFGDVEFGEHLLDLSFLLIGKWAGGVAHVEQKLGAFDLFKRGAKAGDERVGQVADESYGIRQKDLAARGELQLAQLGVKRGEHARGLEDAGLRECVEERALAGVGVPDKRDDGTGTASRRWRCWRRMRRTDSSCSLT